MNIRHFLLPSFLFLTSGLMAQGDGIPWMRGLIEKEGWGDSGNHSFLHMTSFWSSVDGPLGLFFVLLIFGMLYFYFSRHNRVLERAYLKMERQRDLAELKVQAFRAQMNPHFIFNSLNAIDYYIIKNEPRQASQYLNRFSRLIRLILKNARSDYISFRDEVDALELYLEIEALRFNHQFDYEIKIDQKIDQDCLKIPPLLIQPYVENSIWHGLLHQKEQGKIRIEFSLDEQNENILCKVIDNGVGRRKSKEAKAQKAENDQRKFSGVHIVENKIEALHFLHDIHTKVKITDLYNQQNHGIGTQVELSIPI